MRGHTIGFHPHTQVRTTLNVSITDSGSERVKALGQGLCQTASSRPIFLRSYARVEMNKLCKIGVKPRGEWGRGSPLAARASLANLPTSLKLGEERDCWQSRIVPLRLGKNLLLGIALWQNQSGEGILEKIRLGLYPFPVWVHMRWSESHDQMQTAVWATRSNYSDVIAISREIQVFSRSPE